MKRMSEPKLKNGRRRSGGPGGTQAGSDDRTSVQAVSAALLIFVAIAGIAAVAGGSAQVRELIKRCQTLAQQSRHDRGKVSELEALTGHRGGEMVMYFDKVQSWKRGLERKVVQKAGIEELQWQVPADKLAATPQSNRVELVAHMLRKLVATEMGLSAKELNWETFELISSRAKDLSGALTIPVFTNHLQQGGPPMVLRWSMLNSVTNKQVPRQSVHDALLQRAKGFRDWTLLHGATNALNALSDLFYSREMERLNREDQQVAATVRRVALDSKTAIQPATNVLDSARLDALARQLVVAGSGLMANEIEWGDATRANVQKQLKAIKEQLVTALDVRCRAELAKSPLDSLPKLQNRTNASRTVTVAYKQLEKSLGLETFSDWSRFLPATKQEMERLVQQHVSGEAGRIKRERDKTIASFRIESGTNDTLAIDAAVRDLANQTSRNPLTIPSVKALVEKANGQLPVTDLESDERDRLGQAVLDQIRTLKDNRLKEYRRWLATASVEVSAGPGDEAATQKEALVVRTSGQLLDELDKRHPSARQLIACQQAAVARAEELVNHTLSKTRSDLTDYVDRQLNTGVSIGLDDILPAALEATVDRIARGLFPIPAKTEVPAALHGATWNQLSEDQRRKVLHAVSEQVTQRQKQLASDAIAKINERESSVIAEVTALPMLLEDSQRRELLGKAEKEFRERVGAAWVLPGVLAHATRQLQSQVELQTDRLQSNSFAGELAKISAGTNQLTLEIIERPDIQTQLENAIMVNLQGTLKMPVSKFTITMRNGVKDRAAAILKKAREIHITTQTAALQAVADHVDLKPVSGESLLQFERRWLEAIIKANENQGGVTSRFVLNEVKTSLTEYIAARASQKVNQVKELTEEVQAKLGVLGKGGGSESRDGGGGSSRVSSGGGSDITVGGMTQDELERLKQNLGQQSQFAQEKTKIEESLPEIQSDKSLMPNEWFRFASDPDRLDLSQVQAVQKAILQKAGITNATGATLEYARQQAENFYRTRLRQEIDSRRQSNAEEMKAADDIAKHIPNARQDFARFFSTDDRAVCMKDEEVPAYLRKFLNGKIPGWTGMSSATQDRYISRLDREVLAARSAERRKFGDDLAKVQPEAIEEIGRFPEIERLITQWMAASGQAKASLETRAIDLVSELLREHLKSQGHSSLRLQYFEDEFLKPKVKEIVEFEKRRLEQSGTMASWVPTRPSGTPGSSPITSTGNTTTPGGMGTGGNRVYQNPSSGTRTQPWSVSPSPGNSGYSGSQRTQPEQLDLVITFIQPLQDSSRTEIAIKYHKGTFLPLAQHLNEIVNFYDKLGGNEKEFIEVADDIKNWLNGQGGLSKAITEVRLNHSQASNPLFRIHLRTAGGVMPQGLGSLVEKAIEDVAKSFGNGVTVQYSSRTVWDARGKQHSETLKGAPGEFPMTPR